MKKNQELGVGGSIGLTIAFAIAAFLSYKVDDGKSAFYVMPIIGVAIGVILTIIYAVKASNESARKRRQDEFSQTIDYDSEFGNGDVKFYFNNSKKLVTVCATSTNDNNQEEVRNFIYSTAVETDTYLVAVDSINFKIVRAMNLEGSVAMGVCDIKEKLQLSEDSIKESKLTLKSYNNYAFVTDDINEIVVVITPEEFHVHRYSDIVSISFEENGSDVYNKSLGGAVVGGILFGGVGAIVGGNTAKATQNKEVRDMYIKILLKSTSNSTIILKIYEAGVDGSVLATKNAADRALYEGLMSEVSGIKDIFAIIIDIVDKKQTQSPVSSSSSGSVADELAKLAKLKESGILTEEEFNAQKMKLLNL